jgi:hypothetical protein
MVKQNSPNLKCLPYVKYFFMLAFRLSTALFVVATPGAETKNWPLRKVTLCVNLFLSEHQLQVTNVLKNCLYK